MLTKQTAMVNLNSLRLLAVRTLLLLMLLLELLLVWIEIIDRDSNDDKFFFTQRTFTTSSMLRNVIRRNGTMDRVRMKTKS